MIKRLFLIFIFTTISIYCFSQKNINRANIHVKIKNISSKKGKITVSIFNSEYSFLKDPFKTYEGDIVNKELIVKFDNIPLGTYAISCYHDKNSNGKLDMNKIGMPKEPIGTSNNAKGQFGPPKFIDAKFILDKNNISLEISLIDKFH
ncbi:DUF2141 domain-containing protein [Ancylomarina sp. YFZ004]